MLYTQNKIIIIHKYNYISANIELNNRLSESELEKSHKPSLSYVKS